MDLRKHKGNSYFKPNWKFFFGGKFLFAVKSEICELKAHDCAFKSYI